MKRTVLAAALLALVAPGVAPAHAALPTEATVKDARDDLTKFKGNIGVAEISHPYDVYAIKGAVTDTHLKVVITLDDLTKKNTAVYQREDGWWTFRGMFQVQVFVNGAWKWSTSRTLDPGFGELKQMVKGRFGPEHGPTVDCAPDSTDYFDTGVGFTFNYTRDKVTYTVPRECLGLRPGDVLRVATQVSTGEFGKTFYSDHSPKTPKFAVR